MKKDGGSASRITLSVLAFWLCLGVLRSEKIDETVLWLRNWIYSDINKA